MPDLSIATLAEWQAHVADLSRRWLCIGCLERRIGRRLAPADFTDVRANDPELMWMSDRLASRVRGMAVAEQAALW